MRSLTGVQTQKVWGTLPCLGPPAEHPHSGYPLVVEIKRCYSLSFLSVFFNDVTVTQGFGPQACHLNQVTGVFNLQASKVSRGLDHSTLKRGLYL